MDYLWTWFWAVSFCRELFFEIALIVVTLLFNLIEWFQKLYFYMNCCSPEEKLTIQCTAIIPGIGSFYWNAISSWTGGQGPKTRFHTPTHMHGLSNVHFHILWLMQVKESCASDLKGKAFAFLVGLSAFVHEFAHLPPPPQTTNQSIKGSNQPS